MKAEKIDMNTWIGDRFEPIPITPRQMVEVLDSDDEKIKGLVLGQTTYKLSDRFYKTLAGELGIPFGVFGFFSPLEVMTRAAEKEPDLPLRVTVDTEQNQALGLTQDKGLPMPVKFIERVLHDDRRLQEVEYGDGMLSAMLDLDDPWSVPNDSAYHVRVRCRVPVDGVGMPDMSLATWRQVCSNGAVAEAPIFRTKMEIKDNSGEHFRRLLVSFSNPSGIEMLQERMCTAAGTKASVGEVVLLEGLIRRSVANTRNQMLLRERLNEIAANPCVRYGVTDLTNIGQKKRPLLPVGCSVADLLNFASELTTHHADLLKPDSTLHSFAGTLLSKDFDLEDLYPNAGRTSRFYLGGINFSREAA
ncbi:MAG: hypothetical protein IKO72_13710 [Kiritimatiellae bacterium]|nr:hypothetical protein [Kiritimatiellia bacterium]